MAFPGFRQTIALSFLLLASSCVFQSAPSISDPSSSAPSSRGEYYAAAPVSSISAVPQNPTDLAGFLLTNEPAKVKQNCYEMTKMNASGNSAFSAQNTDYLIRAMMNNGSTYSNAKLMHDAMSIAVSRMCPDVY